MQKSIILNAIVVPETAGDRAQGKGRDGYEDGNCLLKMMNSVFKMMNYVLK